MVKHSFYAFAIALLFGSCKKNVDDTFSFNRTEYTGNNLRIDGYYYYFDAIPQRYRIYFFYRNGIVLYGESILQSELESQERRYRNSSYYDMVKKDLSYWGVFRVMSNQIEFESRSSDGSTGLTVLTQVGYIENDTTFGINRFIRSNGDTVNDLEQTYHFKAFSPKPDSSNTFIP